MVKDIHQKQLKIDEKLDLILSTLKKRDKLNTCAKEKTPEARFITVSFCYNIRVIHIITTRFHLQDNGVNLLTFGITKADKYALALLDALFSEDELANSCYKATDRSKKGPLNEEKISLLEGQNEL